MKLAKTRPQNLLISALVSGLFLTAPIVCHADENAYEHLVSRWQTDREQLMRRISQVWLRGEKAESFRNDLMALSQMESGLATKPGVPLYMSAVEDPKDLNNAVGAVVRAYLKNRRVTVNSAEFFRGKSFSVVQEPPTAHP